MAFVRTLGAIRLRMGRSPSRANMIARERYEEALRRLHAQQRTFACTCSRAQLEDELRYPGTCRDTFSCAQATPAAIRLRVEPGHVLFTDRIQGTLSPERGRTPSATSFCKRRDRIYAYVLAVSDDDAAQGVTHIVRGADLLDNTPRQIYLQRLVGTGRAQLRACAGSHGSRRRQAREVAPQRAPGRGFARCRSCCRLFTAGLGAAAGAGLGHNLRLHGVGGSRIGTSAGCPRRLDLRCKRLIILRKNADLP